MKSTKSRRKVTVEWTTSDRKLTAADIDRIEDLLTPLIARLIVSERSKPDLRVENEEVDEGTK